MANSRSRLNFQRSPFQSLMSSISLVNNKESYRATYATCYIVLGVCFHWARTGTLSARLLRLMYLHLATSWQWSMLDIIALFKLRSLLWPQLDELHRRQKQNRLAWRDDYFWSCIQDYLKLASSLHRGISQRSFLLVRFFVDSVDSGDLGERKS